MDVARLGLTDAEAARRLGLTKKAFATWRERAGIPGRRGLRADEEDTRRALLHAGLSDAEAARRLGVKARAFMAWRHSRGVVKDKGRRAKLSEQEEDRRLGLYARGPTDEEAASVLGIKTYAFQSWRHRRGLLKGPTHLTPEEEAARCRFFDMGLTDREAARRVGITHAAYAAWRLSRERPKPAVGPLAPADEARRRAALARGPGDRVAARTLGITKGALGSWRRSRALPCSGGAVTAGDESARLRAFEEGLTDREAAQMLGMKLEGYRWRRRTRRLSDSGRGDPRTMARRRTPRSPRHAAKSRAFRRVWPPHRLSMRAPHSALRPTAAASATYFWQSHFGGPIWREPLARSRRAGIAARADRGRPAR